MRADGYRWFALVAAVCALWCMSALGPTKAEARATEYVGSVLGDPFATVHLTVKGSSRRPRSAALAVTDLQLFHDDGTTTRESRGPRTVSVAKDRAFRYLSFAINDAAWFFYRIEGTLLRNGRARGFLVYIANYHGTSGQAVPDASTQGPVYWEARRV